MCLSLSEKHTQKKIEEIFLVVVNWTKRRQRWDVAADDVADDENVPQRFEIGICSHLFPRANAVLLYRGPQSRLFFGFPVPSKRSRRRGRSRCVFPPFTLGAAATSLFVDDLSFMPPYSFFLSRSLSLSLSLSFARARALALSLSFSFFLSFWLSGDENDGGVLFFFCIFFSYTKHIFIIFLTHFYNNTHTHNKLKKKQHNNKQQVKKKRRCSRR